MYQTNNYVAWIQRELNYKSRLFKYLQHKITQINSDSSEYNMQQLKWNMSVQGKN